MLMLCRTTIVASLLMLVVHATGAEDEATFAETATRVRTAMAHRDLAGSAAALATLMPLATTADDRAVATRLTGIQDRLTRFWESVHNGGKRVTGAEEVEVGDALVAFVEYDRDARIMVLKVRGQVKRYTSADMPVSVALILSDLAMKRGSAASDELVGAFHAMDARGDREAARREWTAAQKSGAETGPLLAELDVPLPGAALVKVPRVTPATASVLDPRQWSFNIREDDIWRRLPLGDAATVDEQKRMQVAVPKGDGIWLTLSHKLPATFAVRFYFLALPPGQSCGVFTGARRGDPPFAAAAQLPPDAIEIELSRSAGVVTCRVNGENCAVEVLDDKLSRSQGIFGISLPAESHITVAGFEVVPPGKKAK